MFFPKSRKIYCQVAHLKHMVGGSIHPEESVNTCIVMYKSVSASESACISCQAWPLSWEIRHGSINKLRFSHKFVLVSPNILPPQADQSKVHRVVITCVCCQFHILDKYAIIVGLGNHEGAARSVVPIRNIPTVPVHLTPFTATPDGFPKSC